MILKPGYYIDKTYKCMLISYPNGNVKIFANGVNGKVLGERRFYTKRGLQRLFIVRSRGKNLGVFLKLKFIDNL